MFQMIFLFTWLPLIGFLASLLPGRKKELLISGIAIATVSTYLLGILFFVSYWTINGSPTLDEHHILLYDVDNIRIAIDFYFDKVTAVFAVIGSVLTLLVTIYSRYFIHREGGYKRFFSNLLLFFLGYNLLVFSGNFETLFIGWEFLGVCTFLLVAFYRERYLPVRNSMKVISFYRLGDICLMLSMWMGHHLWHENIVFSKLNEPGRVAGMIDGHYWELVFIAATIGIAALVKSAQLPFSSWLPRAMEGPTTSSAIFYGSLSVHLGVFLLLRTYPYWSDLAIIRSLIIVAGVLTSVIATSIAKVQSSAKPQIAYSSIAQIGLMFIEVALGFHVLVLIHFAVNAFLRTYQLLVSPSLQHYLIHEMFFNFKSKKQGFVGPAMARIRNSFYILSLKEWNMDYLSHRFFWSPFKFIGKKLDFLTGTVSIVVLIIIYLSGILWLYFGDNFGGNLRQFLPYVFAFVGVLLILKSFSERRDARWGWILVIAGQFFMTLAVALQNDQFNHVKILIYLGGAVIAAIAGYICLNKIRAIDGNISLNQFHGYIYEQPRLGLFFLLCCLALLGIPFTPSFIGVDLLFSHIHKQNMALVVLTSIGFLVMELCILRIYARIFLGLHKKNYHAMAFKSS